MLDRENDVIFLIGAGCSYEASIPMSAQMIDKLETLLKNDEKWKDYEILFNCIRSSIHYADGIIGKYHNMLDIERLVNVLNELEKKENSILYPFIGNWTPRLIEIAGYKFEIISEFKKDIENNLRNWIKLDDYSKASYYSKLFDFQSEFNFSLRVFSLNYDLCLEKNTPKERSIERGFDTDDRIWYWNKFESREEDFPSIYLYKLHGSIDWQRIPEQGNILRDCDHLPDKPDLIFGTDYKMQYIDPYLFYTYEFRKYSLETKLIVIIGYGFRDEHINGILEQSLQNNNERKLLIVSPKADEKAKEVNGLFSKNNINVSKQILFINIGAKEFLETKLNMAYLESLFETKEV